MRPRITRVLAIALLAEARREGFAMRAPADAA